jgi:hypothetical protein
MQGLICNKKNTETKIKKLWTYGDENDV